MRLFEYQTKNIFKKYGIKTPNGIAIDSVEEGEFDKFPVVIKSQVLVGGRGKSGGIKFADNEEELKKKVKQLFSAEIKGERVEKILIEEKINIKQELYLGITLDRENRAPLAIVSASGGIDIEEVAIKDPEMIIKRVIAPQEGFWDYEAIKMMKDIALKGKELMESARVLVTLYKIFEDYDAELVEINPFALTENGEFLALDAKLLIDDNSLYRHKEFEKQFEREYNSLELRAKKAGLTYVELDGDIGIIGNGAGLVMATLDMVQLYGGKPANFCDLGGGASRDRVIEGIDTVLSNKRVKGVLVNVLGGITRCDDVAAGLVDYRNTRDRKAPFVVRMIGTNEEKGKKICEDNGIDVIPTMDGAAKKIVECVNRQ